MKRRLLRPNQILVPGEFELGNPSVLQIYFRLFEKSHGNCLPPAIVVRSGLSTEKAIEERYLRALKINYKHVCDYADFPRPTEEDTEASLLEKIKKADEEYIKEGLIKRFKELKDAYAKLGQMSKKAPFYLVDGNHKTAAATLTHHRVSALELERDEDLTDIRIMVQRGELFDFKRKEKSLKDLVSAFEEYVVGITYKALGHIEDVTTVEKRVDKLVAQWKVPNYMIQRYRVEK